MIDFALAQVLVTTVLWGGYFVRRFGWHDAAIFFLVNSFFPGIYDSFFCLGLKAYDCPGKSALWVWTFLTLGWLNTFAMSFFLAEGILNGRRLALFNEPLWRIPLLTAILGVTLDLFLDPLTNRAGLWVWRWQKFAWHGVPAVNYIGWFLLLYEGAKAWLVLVQARQQEPEQRFWSALKGIPRVYLLPSLLWMVVIIAIFGESR